MATIHISEADAVRDFATLLAQVQQGAEIIIDSDRGPIATIKPAEASFGRPISEVIASLQEAERLSGVPIRMDDDFAADVAERIADRQPRATAWD